MTVRNPNMESRKKNLLIEGNIFKALVTLALPIMGTSFVQTAYNLTDMVWIGRVGSKAVAAVGTAGFFIWLSMAFIFISKIGAEVGVAQAIGRKDTLQANNYIRNSIQLNLAISITYSILILIFRRQLISFFNLGDNQVIEMAITYLVIIAFGMPFNFMNLLFTGIFNGYGDSKTPFIINVIGLGINMVFDPLLIHGYGPFPMLGVRGAAIATIGAQIISTSLFIYSIRKRTDIGEFNLLKAPSKEYILRIIKLGIPVALQSGLFTIYAMLLARIIAHWGPTPIAVQKVGSQIESLSWMTAGGFSSALSAFVGQNYGAERWDRIYKGYFVAMGIMTTVGILTTCLLVFASRPVFSLFIPEEEAIRYGIVYLKILGLSQLFMCIEITTTGAFNGLGKTIPPSIVSIIFTGLRVPAAMILSSENLLGLDGVWWSISISSVFKGIILTTWFIIYLVKNPKVNLKGNVLSLKRVF